MTLRISPLALCAALLLLPGLVEAQAPAGLTLETGRGPGPLRLRGQDAMQQLLVRGPGANGTPADLTREVRYEVAPAGVVRVDTTGLVTVLKEGAARVTVAAPGGLSAGVDVTVSDVERDLPVNFASEVVPVFTKFGCNSGGCHGKASGQNGFKLSLLGFEPEEDFEYITREARGRRILVTAPEHSLLLRKATGQTAHGGGKKLEAGSAFYNVVARWVRQGAPFGSKSDPTVEGVEVLPREAVLTRGAAQQLVVIARMSDGSRRDVTRMTQFESNAADLAEASDTGLVTTKQVPGRAAVMVRFQSHVDVFRLTVPLGMPVTDLPPAKTYIDRLVFRQLTELGLPPSALADDATFLRRVTVDLCGRLPTRKEVEDYTADRGADKADRLVDRLLASEDHADYFANKWSAVLRNRRSGAGEDTKPTFAFHAWIREAVQKNKPYDRFVREILTCTGEEVTAPPVVWYRELKDPASLMEDAAQLFLGQRIGCAKCHHHPLEKWSQEDYFGMVAFFSQVKVTPAVPPKKGKGKDAKVEPGKPASVALGGGKAEAKNPRTNKPVRPRGLGAGSAFDKVVLAPGDDARVRLADWMTAPDNPFFARAIVNRYWKHFLGRGLVDPEDDLRVTNPASNPELLDALAREFVKSGFDLRELERTICKSQVYRLSAVPNAHNAADRQSYSRFLPRRLHAEVLLDAIDEVTQQKTGFKGVPGTTRAVQLPDNMFDSYFLSVFGRPDSASACECERSGEASLAQSLHLLNSQEVLGKVGGARARALAADRRPPAERLRELYLVALSRPPSPDEEAALLAHLAKKEKGGQAAFEDIIWALINTKEFLFNH